MDFSALVTALTSDPQQMSLSMVRVFHFIGLAMGVGAATLLDLMILRFFLGQEMTQQKIEVFAFLADIVSVGLKLLWITGLCFLLIYWLHDPVKLTNQKVWAKMVIVAILTINGWFIHRTVLPVLYGQIGYTLLGGISLRKKCLFVTMGMISVVSWYMPIIIANMPQLNFAVPMLQILLIYAVVLLFFVLTAHAMVCAAEITVYTRQRLRRRSYL